MIHFIRRQHFRPTPAVGAIFNPFYTSRRSLDSHLRALAPRLQGKVLDIGCGSQPYRDYFRAVDYMGLEFDTPENRLSKHADHFYDGKTFPFDDESFDSVLCTEVLEHVFEPNAFVREIVRVLKPKGTLLLAVPFAWDEHEQPYDFGRYSSFGLTHLLTENGLAVATHIKSGAGFRAVAQLFCTTVWKTLGLTDRSPFPVRYAVSLFWAPVHVFGAILQLPVRNEDLYLDNIVLAKKNGGKDTITLTN